MKKDTTTNNEELNGSTFNSGKRKGLDAISQYKQVTCTQCQYNYGGKCNNKDECFSMIIEKELKAFDIVLSKVQLGGFIYSLQKTKNYEEYKNTYITLLTEEEYNLLKEIL